MPAVVGRDWIADHENWWPRSSTRILQVHLYIMLGSARTMVNVRAVYRSLADAWSSEPRAGDRSSAPFGTAPFGVPSVGTSTDVVGFGRVELVSRRAGGPKVDERKDARCMGLKFGWELSPILATTNSKC